MAVRGNAGGLGNHGGVAMPAFGGDETARGRRRRSEGVSQRGPGVNEGAGGATLSLRLTHYGAVAAGGRLGMLQPRGRRHGGGEQVR
jgi:hypothetical protein